MLAELDKATLREIGVTAVCDVIRIVKHARRLVDSKLVRSTVLPMSNLHSVAVSESVAEYVCLWIRSEFAKASKRRLPLCVVAQAPLRLRTVTVVYCSKSSAQCKL